jgi:hypothetical protein
VAALLAGCGDDDDDAGTATSSTDPTPTITETSPTATTPDDAEAAQGTPGADRGGEGERESTAERPTSIDGVIEAVLTGSADAPVICDLLLTEGFVREAYGAREGCLAAERPAGLASTVKIEDASESGGSASATAIPTGGPYDGIEVEVELVADPAEPRAWRVSSLLADVPAGP